MNESLSSKLHRWHRQGWELFTRLFGRSIALALLTAIGLTLMDHLVDSGMTDRFALVHRFPEFIPWILAACTLTFIEMSVLWVRLCVSPQLDVQYMTRHVDGNATAAAIAHLTNTLVWMFRVCVLIYLAQH